MGKDIERIPALPPLMLGGSLWAIRADALPRLFALARLAAQDPASAAAAQVATVGQAAPTGPGVAVLTLCGVLTPFGSMLSYLFGGGSGGVQAFRDQLQRAVADPEVAAIVLDIDSPGGSIGLVPEAAADVRAAADVKPVYAVSDTQACSGAYWIGAQATEFYCTPSGMVGSVGVYYVHEDYSGMNKEIGVDVTYVYAGQFKTEGNPDEPLSDEGRAAWQADADAIYAQFVNAVATGRGVSADTVRSSYGEGRPLLAANALAAGMVDGVDTLQGVISRALTEAITRTGPSARRLGHADTPARIPLASAAAAAPAGADPDDDEEDEDDEEEEAPAPDTPADDDEPDDERDDDDEEDEDEDEQEEPDPRASEPASAAVLPADPAARRLIADNLMAAR